MLNFAVVMAENKNRETTFRFKQFAVVNKLTAMKVGTDGVLLGAWVDVADRTRVLDVGTGTGLIALMVAQRSQQAIVTAIDVASEAVNEAMINFAASPWEERLQAIEADFNVIASESDGWDLIVSNPPFFVSTTRSPRDARATARHGSDFGYSQLIRCGASMLAHHGLMAFISPADREADIVMECALAGLNVRRLTRVYSKQEASTPRRLLWEVGREPAVMLVDSLVVGSDDYCRLTSPFYL